MTSTPRSNQHILYAIQYSLHLPISSNQKTSHSKVKVIIDQDIFIKIRSNENTSLIERSSCGVRTPLEWTLGGPLGQKEAHGCKARSYFYSTEEQLAQKINNWWHIEIYASVKIDESLSRETKRAQHLLLSLKMEFGVFWSDDQLNFQPTIKLPRSNLGLYKKGSVKMMN